MLAGCLAKPVVLPPAEPAAAQPAAETAAPATAEPAPRSETPVAKTPAETKPAPVVLPAPYLPEEAIADVLASPLTYVGSGPWFGMFRLDSCLYRNDRVLVVNVYCTKKEQNAARIDVFSPTRGRVMIYAEAKKPISGIKRAQYLTFKTESEPVVNVPGLALDMSMAKLRELDEQRYKLNGSSCTAGFDGLYGETKPTGDCTGGLESHAAAWKQHSLAFLTEPGGDWHKIVKDMRARALKDGRDQPR